MEEDFKYDVFLSHSSHDKPVVRAVAERLRGRGLAQPSFVQPSKAFRAGAWK